MVNPIYVDDIDITECKNLNIVYNSSKGDSEYLCSNSILGKCKDNNCYYKQLQREKTENEKLLDAIDKCIEYAGVECEDDEQALNALPKIGLSLFKTLLENEALKGTILKANTEFELILKQIESANTKLENLNNKINEVLK